MLRKLTVVVAPLLAAALWCAPEAGAVITTSSVTSPTNPSFETYTADSPNAIAVSGTTDSTTPATDKVDLLCFFGPANSSHPALATGVSLDPATGAFSVPAASLNSVQFHVCRLRAVPAGTLPNLSSFSGPLLATGHLATFGVSAGPNDGAVTDYYLDAQQLTAADDYDSYGSCGLCDGYLFNDATLAQSTTTFFGNDWFQNRDRPFTPGSTRSEIQVDGANAYGPARADQINPDASPGFPALTYSYSLNPANGNLTLTETNPLVKCPDATFPASDTTCPSFVSTGVTDHRTITQESDGHLVFITDSYVSTDGQMHNLDLLPENEQRFSDPGSNGLNIGYQFPGESSFSTHGNTAVVSFPDTVPAAVNVQVNGSPDGDESSGRGAIVFDRPVSPASFTAAISSLSSFHFHQTGLATGSCSPTFSFAYAQDYDSADVQTLAQVAINRFNATPATVCSPPSPGGPAPAIAGPTGRRAAALKKCKKKHSKQARRKCRKKAKRLPV
jgi:hypothetical protein